MKNLKALVLLVTFLIFSNSVLASTKDYSNFDGIIKNDFICEYVPSTTFKVDEYQLSGKDTITEDDKKLPLINELASIQIYLDGKDNKLMNISFKDNNGGIAGNNYFEFSKVNGFFANVKFINPSTYVVMPNSKIRIYIGNNNNEKYFDVYNYLQNISDSLNACPPVIFLERKNDKEYNLYVTKEEADGHKNDFTFELTRSEFGKPGTTNEVITHDLPQNTDNCQFKNPFVTSCKVLTYTSNNWGHLSLKNTRIEFGNISNGGKTSKYLYIKDNNFGSTYSIVSDNKKLTAKLHDISFNISETDYNNLYIGLDKYASTDDIKIVATGYTDKVNEVYDNGIYIYITHKDNKDIIDAYDNENSISTYIGAVVNEGGKINNNKLSPFTGVLTCDGLLGGKNSETRKVLTNILKFIRYGGPILMLLLTIVDLVKTVTSGDDKDFKKVFNNFIKRFIAAVLLFFINDIIKLIFLIVGLDYNCVIDI